MGRIFIRNPNITKVNGTLTNEVVGDVCIMPTVLFTKENGMTIKEMVKGC